MENSLKILIVDDVAENRLLLSRLVKQMGHSPIMASGGQEAIELYAADEPNMVFMDVMMPGMDGYEATARIKALHPDRWVPVVFLSALDSRDSMVKGLEVGGDDYLTKPVHFATLKAKIDAMQRIFRLQEQIRQKSIELEHYYFQAEEEKRISAHLMRQMTDADGLRDPSLKWRIFPAEHHSGDLIAAQRSPGQALYAMLADGTGHGLAAAINVLPLPQIFYAMVSKGFPLSSVARELNQKAYDWLPVDRFVAATIVVVNDRDQLVKVWNGGNPTAFFLSNDGEVLHRWVSRHTPLGVLGGDHFDSHWEAYTIVQPGQVVVVSDGLSEAENRDGEFYGWERMLSVLQQAPPAQRYDALLADLNRHLDGAEARDDISVMLIDVGSQQEELAFAGVGQAQEESADDTWRIELSFGAHELRYFEVVPQVMSLVEKISGIKPHVTSLFLIVSELFNNALDHGLLRLDSRLKNSPEGFEEYLALREQRMAALTEGNICVSCERTVWQGRRVLRIRVKDSGNGFDYGALLEDLANNHRAYGRGLPLVKSLATDMTFDGDGSEVVVLFGY
ncbi:ATP-binding SpoIIE family protein phosphatase [Methylogaea oryzae]|uniref:Fused response regulator/phosphatase n=1 Tax=Methylogaea oryzae TaxID=1295382 RepID=A0A8D4VNS6_9GAMM|nr:fused response regulator/phosphatase [Methylogaea oryzae]BBL71283.1 fused response regulator/phosphatase [Methylogaea oryzae]